MDRAGSNGRPSTLRNLRLLATFLVLWAVPVGAIWIWRGGEDVLVREALFFTGAAFLTFGGAYSVLSYVADVAVNRLRVAHRGPDGAGTGACGVHAGASHHGHPVRRLHRRLERPRTLLSASTGRWAL